MDRLASPAEDAILSAIHPSIWRIKKKLDQLRRDGWRRHAEQLGVAKHRFRLNRPVNERKVSVFEAEHGIELPADYRAFLLEAGDGGAGPYYGILPLARWADHLNLDGFLPGDYLARPNPLPSSFERTDDWLARLAISRDEAFQGTIAICEQGCAYYGLLVVSGPTRGRILYIDQEFQPPILVSDESFLAWYERWLDETLAGLEIGWFGTGPGGSDVELMNQLRTSKEPRTRATAAGELGRRRAPLDAVVNALVDACGDADASVRAAALMSLKSAGSVAGRVAPAHLQDPEAEVRRAAAWVLRQLLERSAVGALRAAFVAESDRETFFCIGCALGDIGGLVTDDLTSHIENPNVEVRSHAAYFLGRTADDQAITLLIPRLDDPGERVRLLAVQALHALGNPRAIFALEARRRVEDDSLVLTNLNRALANLRK